MVTLPGEKREAMEEVERQDSDLSDRLQALIDAGKTYAEISDVLQAAHPSVQRGLSARSVRRFCSSRGISKRTNAEVDAIVSETVTQLYSQCGGIH